MPTQQEVQSFIKWMDTPSADIIAEREKTKAWKSFLAKYPIADKSKFVAQVEFANRNSATAEIYYKEGPGSWINVFGSDSKYWSPEMKHALGLNVSAGGFPQQLTPSGAKDLPIPAVGFHDPAPSLKTIFNDTVDIFVTPDQYFTTKFREIFQKTKLTHHTGKESRKWLAGPDMSYWPQQLNFAVWCATTGCGIGREIFDKDHYSLGLPPNVRNFYMFHVYFTVRRILFQLGGIQAVHALPNDPTFNQNNNRYDVASYKRICAEFGVDPSSDFRFTRPANHGLGSIYLYVTGHGPAKSSSEYPGSSWRFSDEGGSGSKGNLIYYIEPDDSAYAQADWFCPNRADGLTQAGLSRINQSIEAFAYCVLGAQVNVRSSILGSGGRAKEAQSEFLVLVEDAIRQPDLAASVQRYQLAVDQAKVRLNLAVCPGAWLMPGNMIINTESTIGYNNQLKQAVQGMKLGINNEVNTSTKKAGLQLMAGGKSKINPPNSHPSNPIHKAATATATAPKPAVQTQTQTQKEPTQTVQTEEPTPTAGSGSESHDINKMAVAVGAVAVGGLAFWAFR